MQRLRRRVDTALVPSLRLLFLAFVLSLLMAAPASAGDVLRGVCDPGLIGRWSTSGPATVEEFADRLGADLVRLNIIWYAAEPRADAYDEEYLGRVVSAVAQIRARDMRVFINVWGTPRWASDRALWNKAMPGDQRGVYQRYYPPALDALDELRGLMQTLSARLQGQVAGYACWNEPNLWTYFYPQRTASSAAFSAKRYVKMLAAFAEGVRAGDPQAQVIAGETAPFGDDSVFRTSPQRFAKLLAREGAAASFDVYSHHPYALAGPNGVGPAAMPRDTAHTVGLANLGALLRVFPGKPLFLSEFGYATKPNSLHGVWVGTARQASYLRAAFRVAARYEGVEALVWFPLHDSSSTGTYADPWGNYSGLVTLRGQPKRAYYAFAGGNRLTLADPGRVRRRGGTLVLRGSLTSVRMGPLGGKTLSVLARLPGRPWVAIGKTTTRSDGSYVVRFRPYRGATWKVRWTGVSTSPSHWVPVG